jgi:hypothetical protein
MNDGGAFFLALRLSRGVSRSSAIFPAEAGVQLGADNRRLKDGEDLLCQPGSNCEPFCCFRAWCLG